MRCTVLASLLVAAALGVSAAGCSGAGDVAGSATTTSAPRQWDERTCEPPLSSIQLDGEKEIRVALRPSINTIRYYRFLDALNADAATSRYRSLGVLSVANLDCPGRVAGIYVSIGITGAEADRLQALLDADPLVVSVERP